jgi:hypothetical protein
MSQKGQGVFLFSPNHGWQLCPSSWCVIPWACTVLAVHHDLHSTDRNPVFRAPEMPGSGLSPLCEGLIWSSQQPAAVGVVMSPISQRRTLGLREVSLSKATCLQGMALVICQWWQHCPWRARTFSLQHSVKVGFCRVPNSLVNHAFLSPQYSCLCSQGQLPFVDLQKLGVLSIGTLQSCIPPWRRNLHKDTKAFGSSDHRHGGGYQSLSLNQISGSFIGCSSLNSLKAHEGERDYCPLLHLGKLRPREVGSFSRHTADLTAVHVFC